MNTLDLHVRTAHVMTCAVSLFALLLEKKMQREDKQAPLSLPLLSMSVSFAALTLHRRLRRDNFTIDLL